MSAAAGPLAHGTGVELQPPVSVGLAIEVEEDLKRGSPLLMLNNLGDLRGVGVDTLPPSGVCWEYHSSSTTDGGLLWAQELFSFLSL